MSNLDSSVRTAIRRGSAIAGSASRVRESTLLWLVALGGTVGAFIGMWFIRHKTSKGSFLLRFFGIVGLQLASLVVAALMSYGSQGTS